MEELKMKITGDKLSVGKMSIALPNEMFFDGNNCSDNMISFSSMSNPKAPNITITIDLINSNEWDHAADDIFFDTEYRSVEFPVATNGIHGKAYYAYETPGRPLTEEEERLNEMLKEAGDPHSSLLTVDPCGMLAYCATYGFESNLGDPVEGNDLLSVTIYWCIEEPVDADHYVEHINELLRSKNIAEIFDSIKRV